MPDVSQGGHCADEDITGSRRILAMWTMWIEVGSDAPRDCCCLRRLRFGRANYVTPSAEPEACPAHLSVYESANEPPDDTVRVALG
jgi:hypothetical protein